MKLPSMITELEWTDELKDLFDKCSKLWESQELFWPDDLTGDYNLRIRGLIEHDIPTLSQEVCFFWTGETKQIFYPHRHVRFGLHEKRALVFPFIGCDEGTETRFAHWVDPNEERRFCFWHDFKGCEKRVFNDDEVYQTYVLKDKPAYFQVDQFHEVINSTGKERVIINIPCVG